MKPNPNSLCVDASCIGNPGIMEYRAVDTTTHKIILHSPKFPQGTNNIGEFLAIVDCLRYLQKNNLDKIIYSDSQVAIDRIKSKKIKTTLKHSPQTKLLLEKLQEAIIRLKTHDFHTKILKRETTIRGEIPADYNRK